MDEYLQMASVVSDLTYSSYRYNRERAPEISSESWALCFIYAAELEARYQEEKANARKA